MAYPSYRILAASSDANPEDGLETGRATNGTLRGRSFYSGEKRTFKFSHLLTFSELAAFRAYRSSHVGIADSFYWPADKTTYTAMIVRVYNERRVGPSRVMISVDMAEV